MNKVGIVILNYNTFLDTINCIDSIKKYEKQLDYKIYIVDNASKDCSGERLKEFYTEDLNVKVVLSNRNLGFSGGNNLGIKEAIKDFCEYIFLLNSDVVLENRAISIMSKILDENEYIVEIGPTIYNLDGYDTQRARKPLNLKGYIFSRRIICRIFNKKIFNLCFFERNNEEDFQKFEGSTHGCCFGLKRDFILESDALDDNVFMFGEETILSHMIKDSKKNGAISNKAKVLHKESTSIAKSNINKTQFIRLYAWNSQLYILRKYSNCSRATCNILFWLNSISWILLGCKNKLYLKTYRNFRKEYKRLMECCN